MNNKTQSDNNEHTQVPKDFQGKPALESVFTNAQVKEFQRFYNDSNGNLAGKENLQMVAVSTKIRVNYYNKWSLEANQLFALVVNLKRRFRTGR